MNNSITSRITLYISLMGLFISLHDFDAGGKLVLIRKDSIVAVLPNEHVGWCKGKAVVVAGPGQDTNICTNESVKDILGLL